MESSWVIKSILAFAGPILFFQRVMFAVRPENPDCPDVQAECQLGGSSNPLKTRQ
jgi:hypothetical protein